MRRRQVVLFLLGAPLLLGQGPSAPNDDVTQRTTPEDFGWLRKVEQVHLDDVWAGPQQERAVELYVRALTRYGEPVGKLRKVDLAVLEDGRQLGSKALELTSLKESGRGVACVLALDNSRTMSGGPLDAAKEAAVRFMDRLGPRDRVAVISFAGAPNVVSGFDESRARGRVLLQDVGIEENSLKTTLYDGVYAAVELIRRGADLPRRTIVIAFSDGVDGGSNHNLDQVIQLANGTKTEPRILVFSIGYPRFGRAGMEILRKLADETGASHVETNSPRLGAFYDSILEQLHQSYVVRFPSSMDGNAHTIEVVIDGQRSSRNALYPDIPVPIWPYLAGGGAVLGILIVVWLIARLRSPGRLVFVSGPRAGEVVRLRRGQMRIGALAENDIVIAMSSVSRYHAELRVGGRRVEIEDLRSANGTQVNGARVERSPLRPGDRLRIADIDLVFER